MEAGSEAKTLVAAVVLAVLWVGEVCVPFYTDFPGGLKQRLRHDARNFTLGVFNGLVLLLLFFPALAAATSWASESGFGLLPRVAWPFWAETLLVFVLFDLWMYLWHRANHEIHLLWRFHRMHHSDPEMDASTALRFHVGEVLLSGVARLAVIPLLGMSLGQLALYEMVFLPVVLFHHSNVSFPRWLDHGLLAVVVTPAMHRVHHSRRRVETDSNYGSVFPYWDMAARSFRLRADARTIHLGLDGMDARRWQSLSGMLATPLGSVVRSDTSGSPSDSKGR